MFLIGRQDFGRRKNDPAKDRKALETYVELKGYKHGEIGNGEIVCYVVW